MSKGKMVNILLTRGGDHATSKIKWCSDYNKYTNHSDYLASTRNFCCVFFGGEWYEI